MIKYTNEIEKQDKLWETENEDIDKMLELYEEIMTEAKKKGFVGRYDIYEHGEEGIITLWLNAEDDEEDASFGYCLPLIRFLEEQGIY